MRRLVILSGKGGTGKTSVTAALASLAAPAVLVDADVDASDLPLVLSPLIESRQGFIGGALAQVQADRCDGCNQCLEACRFQAIRAGTPVVIDPLACEGCGVCVLVCPRQALSLADQQTGEWCRSQTRHGPLVHACLEPGAGSTGKLVHQVREEGRRLAETSGAQLLLIDGPPGIGCPAIAALSGADLVLMVSEPTPSGAHDLIRVLELARHFRLATAVCINKADLCPTLTDQAEALARHAGAVVLPRLPYDPTVTAAQRQARSVVEHDPQAPASQALARLWQDLRPLLFPSAPGNP